MGVFPLVFLVGMIPLLGGIAGIVLFVVGLAKKRPALWGSGIALAAVSLVIAVVGAGVVFFFGMRKAAVMSQKAVVQARQAVAEAVAKQPEGIFLNCMGLPMPPDVEVVGHRVVTYPPPAGQSIYYMKLRPGKTIETLFAKHFSEASWSDVREDLTGPDAQRLAFWGLSDGTDKRCYKRTHRSRPGAPDRIVTNVAYDPNASVAWFVSVQQWDR